MRQKIAVAVMLGTGGVLAATGGLALAGTGSYTFSNPASQTPGGVSGLATTTKFFVPTFGTATTSSTGSYTGATPGSHYFGGGGYVNPAGGFPQGGPTAQSLANSEAFFAGNTLTVPAANASFSGPAHTFTMATGTTGSPNPVNAVEGPPIYSTPSANDVLQGSNPFYPENPNTTYGAKADVAYMVDQQGYIDISTAGTYTFTVNAADDQLALYIGGSGGTTGATGINGISGAGNTGTLGATGIGGGKLIADGSYAGAVGTFPVTSSVDFTATGLYHFEDYFYQGYGGQAAAFSIGLPTGANAPAFFTAVVTPEPATIGLLAIPALALLLIKRRKHIACT